MSGPYSAYVCYCAGVPDGIKQLKANYIGPMACIAGNEAGFSKIFLPSISDQELRNPALSVLSVRRFGIS